MIIQSTNSFINLTSNQIGEANGLVHKNTDN